MWRYIFVYIYVEGEGDKAGFAHLLGQLHRVYLVPRAHVHVEVISEPAHIAAHVVANQGDLVGRCGHIERR